MNKDTLITQDYLKSILIYDPISGDLTWIKPSTRRLKVGDVAGWREPNRYTRINIKGKLYYAHRLAFLYMTGRWSENDIDHINGKKSDNAWVNLREATRSQNFYNRGISSNNTTGVKGVSWDKAREKFAAKISVDGKLKNIGRFDNIEDAKTAYQGYAKKIHGEYYYNT